MPTKNKKKLYLSATVIFFLFAFMYVFWVLVTYRNIVHMDIINIISSNIKHLYEGNLKATDFFYQPLFPCLVSLTFTFFNAKLLHLNTTAETIVGMFFLILAGYKYLKELSFPFVSKTQAIVFAFVASFILFGFHKWEAAFTSFFSFSAFFDLSIIFFSYFFIAAYIDPFYTGKPWKFRMLIISNVLLILEATSYYYSYALLVIIMLFLIKKFNLVAFDKKRLNLLLLANTLLLSFALLTTFTLGLIPALQNHGASQVSIGQFLTTFIEKPFWIIEFYLLANTGPLLGDEVNNNFQALIGLLILIGYGVAIYYFIKKKEKWMLVPVFLILYNIIAYAFITLSRYKFDILSYGASSRYTAFTLSGILGLASILVYYIFFGEKKIFRYINGLALLSILICYANMIKQEKGKSPYRTEAFIQMKEALLSGENLGPLQAGRENALIAIDILKKYKLNVYYNYSPPLPTKLNYQKIKFTANTPAFLNMKKSGIYGSSNEPTWTDGNAFLYPDSLIQVADSMTIRLETYMPPICKNVTPRILIIDTKKTEYQPVNSLRKGDIFTYKYYFSQPIVIKSINIKSDTIHVSPPDLRKLSFPFLELEIKSN